MELLEVYGYGYDDVFIIPKYSEINSRKDVDLSTKIGNINLKVPIISANMKSITGTDMCVAMHKAGGLGILHRFWTIEENVKAYADVREQGADGGVSIGLDERGIKRAKSLHKAGASVFCIDVAHGAQKSVMEQAKRVKEIIGSESTLIVGNFASSSSMDDFDREILLAGGNEPDVYKVGISNGAACTTRVQTGVGVPQFSSVLDCSIKRTVIADGGIKNSGDIAKALGVGAKAVMIGKLLIGTKESEAPVKKTVDGVKYKEYRGSASKKAYKDCGKNTAWRAAEGTTFDVPCTSTVEEVIGELCGGIRSTFTYTGSKNLEQYHRNVSFARQTTTGWREGTPHGVS